MKKTILYCNSFQHGDMFMKKMMDSHPRKDTLYRAFDHGDGSYQLMINLNGAEHGLFLSGLESSSRKNGFRFQEVTAYTFFDMQIIPSETDVELLSEWMTTPIEDLDAADPFGEDNLGAEDFDAADDDWLENDLDIEEINFGIDVEFDGRKINAEMLLLEIYGGIFKVNHDFGIQLLDNIIDIDSLLSVKDYKVNYTENDLYNSIQKYKETGEKDHLAMAQLMIISLLYNKQ